MTPKSRAEKARTKKSPSKSVGTGEGSELARVLLMHAVGGIFDGCGNSYANAYTEKWLTHAKALGAYHGPVVGTIIDLREKWEAWLDANGLPDLPNGAAQTRRT